MVAESLVKEPLTLEMVRMGDLLTREIDVRIDLAASFWYFLSESVAWRLYLATPLVASEGPSSVYRLVQSVLPYVQDQQSEYRLYTLTLSDISVIDVQHTLVKVMRAALVGEVVPPQQVNRGRFTGLRVGRRAALGHYIEDAYVYKV